MDCPTCGSDEFDVLNQQAHSLVAKVMQDIKDRPGFQEVLYSMTEASREEMWDELYELMEIELVRFKLDLQG